MAVQKKPLRKNIPMDRETAVLINSGRRCVLCFHLNRDLEEKHGQIAHLDGDRTNRAEDNLAWMCLPHHSLFDSKTSQHKNYSLAEVKAARRNLYAAVQKGRHQESPSPRVSTRRYGHQDFIKIVTGPRSALKSFLCHASDDKQIVRDIYYRLKSDGFTPWFDEVDLLPGHDWEAEIRAAVRASNAVIVCLSCTSVTKEGYLQKEIRQALEMAAESRRGRSS